MDTISANAITAIVPVNYSVYGYDGHVVSDIEAGRTAGEVMEVSFASVDEFTKMVNFAYDVASVLGKYEVFTVFVKHDGKWYNRENVRVV